MSYDEIIDLMNENSHLKNALKEMLDNERNKLIDPSHLTPFIDNFLRRHGLKPEEFK